MLTVQFCVMYNVQCTMLTVQFCVILCNTMLTVQFYGDCTNRQFYHQYDSNNFKKFYLNCLVVRKSYIDDLIDVKLLCLLLLVAAH